MNGGLLAAAHDYARAGFSVFPCRSGGKEPAVARGFLAATCDPGQVSSWWEGMPTANIGIAIPAGLFVLDLDSPDAAARLRAAGVDLVATVNAQTPRGAHFWYSAPLAVRPAVGVLRGVDVRGVGSYVVVPPSVVNGNAYRWVVPLRRESIAPAPDSLLRLLKVGQGGGEARFRKHVEEERGDIAMVSEGGRNDFLTSACGHLLRCNVDAELVPALTHGLNTERCSPPLPRGEVDAIVRSIAIRELTRREGRS